MEGTRYMLKKTCRIGSDNTTGWSFEDKKPEKITMRLVFKRRRRGLEQKCIGWKMAIILHLLCVFYVEEGRKFLSGSHEQFSILFLSSAFFSSKLSSGKLISLSYLLQTFSFFPLFCSSK